MKETQEELSVQFEIEDPPSMSDMRCSATHEPAVAVDVARDMVPDIVGSEITEMVIQKSTSTGAMQLWRITSLAINACSRMRLVVESLRALDENTVKQTVTGISSLFSSPLAQLPNCSTTEKRHCRSIIIGASSLPAFVPSFYRTNSGKVRVVFESVEPVEQGNESEIAGHLIAVVAATTPNIGSCGGWEIPDLQNPIPGTVSADNVNDWIEELTEDEPFQFFIDDLGDFVGSSNSETGFAPNLVQAAQSGINNPSPNDLVEEFTDDELFQFFIDDLGDVVGSSNSETGFAPNLVQAAQSGINNPSTPDTTLSVHPLVHSPVEGIQHSPTMSVHPLGRSPMDSVQHAPVRGASCDRMSYQTASERWEEDNGGGPGQERHRKSDLEPQMQLGKFQECRHWNDLISCLINQITAEISKIDQASDRAKLINMKQEACSTSSKLDATVRRFKGNLEKFRKDIRSVVEKYSNAGPQRLLRAVSTLIESFERGSLNTLSSETDRISKRLSSLGRELRLRELSAGKIAQNCASSLTTLVKSFLTEQSVNFLSVADSTNRYPKNFPGFR